MNTKEFKARKYLVTRMKDGSPIKTNHQAIHNHKIAALIFLVIDNGEKYPDLVDKCVEVADNIYNKVDEIRKNTYIQNLQNRIEARVTKNFYVQILLLSVSLIQGNATSPIALELITMINQIVDNNSEKYNHINVDSKLKRLHRIIKKNYKPMS